MVNAKPMATLLVMLTLTLAGVAPVAAAVDVSIDRNPVQVNESFQLVFSLDQNPDRDPDFSILQQHFLILGNNRSSSISIINGEYQRSIKWTLHLMPKQIGEFMIPAIRFGSERSEPFQVTVKPSTMASVPHDQLVLEVLADRSETYVQSQVILTLRLLSATDISAYQFGDVSIEAVDAVVEPLGDVRQYQTRIADKSYLVLEKQFALFPQQSGRLEVAPVMAEVRLPSRSSYDPFQTGGEIRRLRSQPVFIDIEPIPADFTAPYWLPANHLELRENWQGDLNALVAGEPVTRSVTLIADGLTAAQLPELILPAIDGIKQYPDQPSLDDSRSSDGIRGRREQKVALIPGAAGRYYLPEISLPWWNLQTGKVEIATLPARELSVNPGTGTAPQGEPVVPGRLATAPAEPVAAETAETGRFWLWLSLVLACGWGASIVYWGLRVRRERWRRQRQPESASLARARRELRKACDDGDAASARQALLVWGQALLTPRRVHNLHDLGAIFGADLASQIGLLNQSLYARTQQSWQGQALMDLCLQLEQSARVREPEPAGLAPLNPVG